MAVDAVRINEDIERGARGGPGFKTTVIGVGSGKEQRNAEWSQARGQWDIAYGVSDKETYSEFIAFFRARLGRQRGFLFKDWSDFEAARQQIGTGNGINTDFQLTKTYTDPVNPHVRTITRPVSGTVNVWVDNVLQTEGVDYTVEPGGIIRFAVAPADTLVVEAEFEFDVPVRFDVDQLDLDVLWYDAASVPELLIVELRE